MRIELESGTPAEVVLPAGTASRGVVICPDIFGLRPLFDDMCAQLASEHGWAVAAVEPFPGADLGADVESRFAAVATLDDVRVLGDLRAAADDLAERAGVHRIAVLGFCMGGMYAYKAAGTERFDKAVSFYGMIEVPEAWMGTGHAQPLECVQAAGASPVLAIIGGQDKWTPTPLVERLRACSNVEAVVYPDADHGFVHDATRPAHRADDAADAWRRVTDFLA